MSIPVVTLGVSTWPLVDGIERLHGPVTVVRRCLDLTELLAAARSGLARAALVAEGAEEITASLLDQLRLGGVALLVLEGHDAPRLAGLGATVVPERAEPAEAARLVERAVAGAPAPAPTGYADPAGAAGRESVPGRTGDAGPLPDADPGPRPAGRIVAVWGPTGAPGRTTVAVNLAAELALLGEDTALVDADTYGPSVAAALGMLDEAAGLAQACRLADQGRLDGDALRRTAADVAVAGRTLRVLTGLTRQDRWPELRSSAVAAVLERSAREFGTTVVDCGFALEADEELSFDTVAPRRHAAALTALEHSDVVVAVGAADTIGVPRLVKGLPDVAAAAPGARLVVAVNKLRRSAAGRSPELGIREAWQRFGPGPAVELFLPWDPEALDEALLAGAVLAETAAGSPVRAGLRELAALVLAGPGEEAAPVPPVHGTRLGGRVGAWLRR
ncbi:pilus biosynthesis protein CpaE [Kocuria dechangensis]|uniref:Pilus biosynthesis protein CpaE n=1 Tax=Kocuria dechangensis TaxID=1176249 RepID=A0A917LQE0_9MICC|nr:P-loop NTPase [Kocuria dechangensis]GGG49955.1 pilus biosynthesis protein CpaE [Kocuria dechangensis]